MTNVDATTIDLQGAVREASEHAQRAAEDRREIATLKRAGERLAEQFAAEHAMCLDAAVAGIERLARAARRDLDRAMHGALKALCAPNVPAGQLPPAVGVDQREAVSRLGERDSEEGPRRVELLSMAAAVGHADVLRAWVDEHAEEFSPLTAAERDARAEVADGHLAALGRLDALAEERAGVAFESYRSGSNAVARFETVVRTLGAGFEAHDPAAFRGLAAQMDGAPGSRVEAEALAAAAVHAADRAAVAVAGTRDDAERELEALRAALAGEKPKTTTKR